MNTRARERMQLHGQHAIETLGKLVLLLIIIGFAAMLAWAFWTVFSDSVDEFQRELFGPYGHAGAPLMFRLR